MKSAGCQTESKSFQEIDCCQNRPRTPVWVCKTHPKWTEKHNEFDQEYTDQNGNGPGGKREWSYDSRKKSKHDKIIRSDSFPTEICGSHNKFSGKEGRAERGMRLLRARSQSELEKVTSDSDTQDLWMRNGKVGSELVGVVKYRLPGRSTVGKVRKGGITSDRMEEKIDYLKNRFSRKRRAYRLPCLSLGFSDNRRDML